MPSTRSKRKQQTQLSFSPLPDSSPAKTSQPRATRNRAAAVTLLNSPRPTKRARTGAFLPTPEASSQPDNTVGNEYADDGHADKQRRDIPRYTISFSSTANEKKRNRDAQPTDLQIPPTVSQRLYKDLLEAFDDSESDEDAGIPLPQSGREVTAATRRRTRGSIRRGTTRSNAVSVSSDEDGRSADTSSTEGANEVARDDSESEIDANTRGMQRLKQAPMSMEDDSPESVDAPVTPPRHKMLSRQDQQDLEDDLEDLRSSSPPTAVKPTQGSARKTALEAYKRYREKQQLMESSRRRPRIISDDEDEASCEQDEPIYADAEQQKEGYYDEAENDDFIIQDEEDGGGASALPLEIRLSSAKWSELFPHVVEWMVQKRLNPGFSIDDQIYDLAFRKLDDYARYMGGSKFQSSVWNGTFLRALKGRPTLEEKRFVNLGLEHDSCDACNRSGHPATYEFKFTGSTYSKDTLEDVSEDEEADTRDEALSSEDRIFYIGKHCAANARTAHALAHWQRHLYDWVVDWLDENGHLKNNAVVKRDRMTTAKRTKAANDIVDYMRETKVIKELLKTFKNEIETAQEQQQQVRQRYRSP